MTTYFADLSLTPDGEKPRTVLVSLDADKLTGALRILEVWSAAVEATLPTWRVTVDGISTTKKRGKEPIPLLASTLLARVFQKLDVKELK